MACNGGMDQGRTAGRQHHGAVPGGCPIGTDRPSSMPAASRQPEREPLSSSRSCRAGACQRLPRWRTIPDGLGCVSRSWPSVSLVSREGTRA